MNTVLRISLGLLLTVSAVGCHTCHNQCGSNSGCGHRSCLHKLFPRGSCGCQDACGCSGDVSTCECEHHSGRFKRSKRKYEFPAESAMHGYGNSVVYTGDDWQGIPQPVMGGVPGCSGCSGPVMGGPIGVPSTGCAGCSGGAMPTPSVGGCASCGGNHSAPAPVGGGCASCGGGIQPTPSSVPATPGCASCGAGATPDSFYNPLGPGNVTPAPAPPAESSVPSSAPPEGIPGSDKAASGEPIQKIHWVPRQL